MNDDGSGFRVITGPGPVEVWVESDLIDECVAHAREAGSGHIALSPFMGFEGTTSTSSSATPTCGG